MGHGRYRYMLAVVSGMLRYG